MSRSPVLKRWSTPTFLASVKAAVFGPMVGYRPANMGATRLALLCRGRTLWRFKLHSFHSGVGT